MPPVRIALLQYAPEFGKVKDNIAKVDAMLADVTPGSIDILLLPEMAFTGYMMRDINEAQLYLEMPSEEDEYDTMIWAKRTSKRLRCYTLVGFPERDPDSCAAYNSLLVVDTTGKIQDVYKKHFLYETDKTWALPGQGFVTMELNLPGRPDPLIVAPAICMDLNPKNFVAPFEVFEFGQHCKRNRVDLVLCAMNWLASEPPLNSPTTSPANVWNEVKDTILYWFVRLTPLSGTKAIFAGCNRVGTERGSTFTGSSCIFKLSEPPSVLAYASKTEEKILFTEVDIP